MVGITATAASTAAWIAREKSSGAVAVLSVPALLRQHPPVHSHICLLFDEYMSVFQKA
jgi:hypothetical protein